MPGIPTYERRVGAPEGTIGVARPDVSGVGRGAQAIGQGLMSLGESLWKANQYDQAKQRDQQILTGTNAISAGNAYWDDQVTNTYQPAYNQTQQDQRKQFNEDFDKWKSQQAGQFTDPVAQAHFDSQAEAMRSRYTMGLTGFQRNADTNLFVAQNKVGMEQDYQAITKDPSRFDEITSARKAAVAQQGYLAAGDRVNAIRAYELEAAAWAETGTMRQNPAAFLATRLEPKTVPGASGTTLPAGATALPAAGDPVNTALPSEARAFLNVIAGPESAGQYDIRYTPAGGAKFALNGQHPAIPEAGPAGASTAAGRYQITKSTWDRMTGGTLPFTPENQDMVAWSLAQQDYAKRTGGKDLLADLRAGGVTPAMLETLKPTWAGLSGEQAGKSTYADSLKRMGGDSGVQPALTAQVASGGLTFSPDAPKTFQALDPQKQYQLIDEAQRLVKQQEAQQRGDADRVMADATAMHKDGKLDPFNLDAGYFVRAYGAADGLRRYGEYQAGRTMASDIQNFATQTPGQVAATLQASVPQPGEGYAAADARQNIRIAAATATIKARSEDPVLFAMEHQLTQAQPIDMAQPNTIGPELNKRIGTAQTMSGTYLAPYRILTNGEASQMSAALRGLPTQAKLQYLDNIRTGLNGDTAAYQSVMNQVAGDSPVTSMAGQVLVEDKPVVVSGGLFGHDTPLQPRNVAGIMLEGEALLNPTKDARAQDGRAGKFPMPKEVDLRQAFDDFVGTAFRGNATGYNVAFQAFQAYYAGKAAREGLLSNDLDGKRALEAATAATGGVINYNGAGQVIKPWGLDDATFKDRVHSAFDAAMTGTGYKGTSYDNLGAYGLEQAGADSYRLTNGTGYLLTPSGAPVTLYVGEPTMRQKLGLTSPAWVPPPDTARRQSGLIRPGPAAVATAGQGAAQ